MEAFGCRFGGLNKKEKKIKSKGSITVYLCLALCVILSLIFACFDSARLSAGRAALSCAVDEGLFSLFSNYDKTLYEKYGLLFMDASAGTENLQLGSVAEETLEYTEKVLDGGSSGVLGTTPAELYNISLGSPAVTGYILSTDSSYAPLVSQICEAMVIKLGMDGIQKLAESLVSDSGFASSYGLENESEIDSLTDKYEKQKELAEQYAEDAAKNAGETGEDADDDARQDSVEIPDDFQNPIENISKLRSLGIMSFALPDGAELSGASIDLNGVVSKRTLNSGMGVLPDEESGLDVKALVSEFAVEMLPDYLTGSDEGTLQYQAEYVIAGKGSDIENLKSVMNRILLLRTGLNYAYIYTSAEKNAEAYEIAAIISAILLSPEAIEIIAQVVKLLWAYAEGMMDVKSLLSGGKVPIFKDASSWQTSLSLFSSMNSGTSADSGGSGLDYSSYLRILMYMLSDEDLTKRTADMIEYNVRNASSASFRLDNCIESFQIELPGSIGSHEITINRSYSYASGS